MTRYLFDVNVLIALIDPTHLQHDRAHAWFASTGKTAWATCPITENGVIRIVGSSRYPNSPGNPSAVAEIVDILCGLGGHEYWPDDISIFDKSRFDADRLLDSAQITDSYLLGLARAHSAKLATFDRHIVTDAVIGGMKALYLIP